jgi:hypothetical protein
VNGECYESTLAEVVLISPTVHDVLRNNRSCRVFVISDEDIDEQAFDYFLDFIRCHDSVSLSEDKSLSFILICRLLGNERLALILLHHIIRHQHRDRIRSLHQHPQQLGIFHYLRLSQKILCFVVRMLIIVHHISIPFQMTNFGVWSGRRFM